ncbi:MAG: ABC transporter permease [Egibacteraceae bacterium]
MSADVAGVADTPGVGARRRLLAQARMELRLLLRNSENLLVTFGIPIALLVFFALVPVLPTAGQRPVDFLVPGVVTVAAMGAAMVSLGIATGFERAYLVLKRLGATPLRRAELVGAKALAIGAVQLVQLVVLLLTAVALGWQPTATAGGLVLAGAALVLATAAFAGIGLALAGGLPALGTLAVTNAAFLVLLLMSGLVFPVQRLPDALVAVALLFPPAWLARVLRAALSGGGWAEMSAGLAVLALWALLAPWVAARVFRWE